MSMLGESALLIAAAVAAGAFCQALTGMGFALVSSPLLVLVLGPKPAIAVLLLLHALLNVAILLRDRADLRLRWLAPLLVPAALLTPLCAWLVQQSAPRLLAAASGLFALGGAALLAGRWRIGWLRGRRGAFGLGAFAALSNAASGAAGPPIALYALNDELPARAIRPTFQVFFLTLNLIALPFSSRHAPPPIAYLALVLGLLAGGWLAPRLPERRARAAVLLIVAVSGAVVVARALLG